jgi:hypothetical protein
MLAHLNLKKEIRQRNFHKKITLKKKKVHLLSRVSSNNPIESPHEVWIEVLERLNIKDKKTNIVIVI